MVISECFDKLQECHIVFAAQESIDDFGLCLPLLWLYMDLFFFESQQ
jgi:hypothetical protein